MVLKKIDNRIRLLVENGVQEKHRTMFVIVGDHARDQVCILKIGEKKVDTHTRAVSISFILELMVENNRGIM